MTLCGLHASTKELPVTAFQPLPTRTRPRVHTPTRLAVLLTLLALSAAPALAQGDVTLGYAEALDLAGDAPTVTLARQTLERSERQAASNDAPFNLAVTGGYGRSDGSTTPRDGADAIETEEGSFDPLALNVTLDPAWGGATRDARARAAATLQTAREDLEAAQRTARIDVTAAFQDALHADVAHALAQEELALAQANADAARQRFEAGAASDLDVAQADLDVARAEQARASAERDLEQARTLLASTLGLPSDTRLVPTGPLPAPPAVPVLSDPAEVIDARGDVQAAARDVADAERTTQASIRDVLPVVTFDARYLTGSDETTTSLAASIDTTRLTPTLSASWDPDTGLPTLGEGGTSRELQLGVSLQLSFSPALPDALAAVRIGEDQARGREDVVRQQATLAVQRAYDAALDAAERADLAHRAAELSHEALRIARLRLEAGSGSEAAVTRARIDAARAELDAERADGAQRLAVFRLLDALAANPDELE